MFNPDSVTNYLINADPVHSYRGWRARSHESFKNKKESSNFLAYGDISVLDTVYTLFNTVPTVSGVHHTLSNADSTVLKMV